MIYKNKDRVDEICAEIDKHREKLNDLCGATVVEIVDKPNSWNIHTIRVVHDSSDEYVAAGMVMINFIKDDLKRKIADLHTELKKL